MARVFPDPVCITPTSSLYSAHSFDESPIYIMDIYFFKYRRSIMHSHDSSFGFANASPRNDAHGQHHNKNTQPLLVHWQLSPTLQTLISHSTSQETIAR